MSRFCPDIIQKPVGPYCYKIGIFVQGERCPNYDGRQNMKPQCKKHGALTWTVSGKVLKHPDCVKEEE